MPIIHFSLSLTQTIRTLSNLSTIGASWMASEKDFDLSKCVSMLSESTAKNSDDLISITLSLAIRHAVEREAINIDAARLVISSRKCGEKVLSTTDHLKLVRLVTSLAT